MIEIVAIGEEHLHPGVEVLDALAAGIARELRISCRVRAAETIDASFAYDPVRNQHHSTAILRHLAAGNTAKGHRILGVAAVDLYVPIFTFVFGEAQLGGPAALISDFRLRQEFYGEPSNPALARERLLKEALHELGHTFGLRHCHDWTCPMSATTAIERLDWKSARYCDACFRALAEAAP